MTTPILLVVLDGWGYRKETDHNAIAQAHTPTWDRLWNAYPHLLINTSGADVGLPEGQMGNSEVGHIHMGAGRLVPQSLMQISEDINTGRFFDNPTFTRAFKTAAKANKTVHIMGLLSPGGVHSHEDHIAAAITLAQRCGVAHCAVHAILDGRDTPPRSAKPCLKAIADRDGVHIASVIGRYYAMDRDLRWDRTEKAYSLFVDGRADHRADTADEALQRAYARGENDEFVEPTAIYAPNAHPTRIEDGDVVVFMNFRADRARQLSHAFTGDTFEQFERHRTPRLSSFITLTAYPNVQGADIAYPKTPPTHVLGDVVATHHLPQLRIAETEKYAHVTFFFNGGVEAPFPHEKRILIPSPKVKTYDLQPEMSAHALTDQLVEAIESNVFPLIICNYANADMVGHTGHFDATIKAIETLDTCLKRVTDTMLKQGGITLITADHGNAEYMYNPTTGQPYTAHTSTPVPLLCVGADVHQRANNGSLQDIAPTILTLMNLPIPKEMTGEILYDRT